MGCDKLPRACRSGFESRPEDNPGGGPTGRRQPHDRTPTSHLGRFSRRLSPYTPAHLTALAPADCLEAAPRPLAASCNPPVTERGARPRLSASLGGSRLQILTLTTALGGTPWHPVAIALLPCNTGSNPVCAASHLLSYTVPWSLSVEMEAGVPDSFLELGAWRELRERQ